VRGVAIAGLHHPVVVAGGEEHHVLRLCRLDHATGVGADPGAAGEDAEVECLEVGELVVRSLDLEHDLPGRDRVAVVQCAHLEGRPVVAAELEDRDRLVDAAEERVMLGVDLHGHARRGPVAAQHLARAGEVLVRVVAGPHLLDGQVEDRGVEAGSGHAAQSVAATAVA